MATVDDVRVRYEVVVNQAINEINKLIAAQDKVVANEKKSSQDARINAKEIQFAAKARQLALKNEVTELNKLVQARKKAFTPEQIGAFNSKIGEVQNRIRTLRGETQSFGATASDIFAGVGATLLAAFSVDQIIRFSKVAIDSFLEAEASVEKLRFAITAIGGESETAFGRLVEQSKQLQGITIFSDESIQQAQAALAAFNLTSDQIEALIPQLTDFATVTGQDLAGAVQQVGSAIQGNGRALKRYQIEVSTTNSEMENLAAITQGLTRFNGAAEQSAKTLAGQLKVEANAADELAESIGERLAPAYVKMKTAVLNIFSDVLDGITKSRKDLQKENELMAREAEKSAKFAELQGKAEVFAGKGADEATKQQQLQIQLQKEFIRVGVELINTNRQLKEEEDFFTRNTLRNKIKALTQEAGIVKELMNAEADRAKDAINNAGKLEEQNQKAGDDIRKNKDDLVTAVQAITGAYSLLTKEQQQFIDLFEASFGNIEQFRDAVADVSLTNQVQAEADFTAFIESENAKRVASTVSAANDQEEAWTSYLDSVVGTFIRANQQEIQAAQQLAGEITSIFSQLTQNRINDIQAVRDAELSAISTQEEALQEALERRQITENEAAKRNIELTRKKLEAEQAADKKLREIKRKQAIVDKANALFQIAIETAKNIVEAGANVPLQILMAALGAAQAAVVVSQPIPSYAKGTKDSGREGLAKVHRDEVVFMPESSQVLPAAQSRRHKELITAMFDNSLDELILRKYITPALQEYKQQQDQNRQKSFAQNITESLVVNSPGVDRLALAREMARNREKGINVNNVDQFARAVGEYLQKDIYR